MPLTNRVVTVDSFKSSPENWVDFIPETKNVLTLSRGGNNFLAHYMVDAISTVKQYDYQGNEIREVKLPGMGTDFRIWR